MTEDLMRYDVLTQDALRNVIRKVLDEVATAGLPGDHHFFISFETTFPGVRLSNRMRERYPETMTIVIQHSFWDLKTTDTYFEIDLSFDEIRERLKIPFASVQSFFDPAVKFGLQFEVPHDDDEIEEDENAAEIENSDNVAKLPTASTVSKGKRRPKKADENAKVTPAKKAKLSDIEEDFSKEKPSKASTSKKKKKSSTKKDSSTGATGSQNTNIIEEAKSNDSKSSADVVSLDAFRKK